MKLVVYRVTMTDTVNVVAKALAMAPIVEATEGFIVRLSAAVRPRTLRLPLVLLPRRIR